MKKIPPRFHVPKELRRKVGRPVGKRNGKGGRILAIRDVHRAATAMRDAIDALRLGDNEGRLLSVTIRVWALKMGMHDHSKCQETIRRAEKVIALIEKKNAAIERVAEKETISHA